MLILHGKWWWDQSHNFAHATEAELLRVTMNLFEVAKMYIYILFLSCVYTEMSPVVGIHYNDVIMGSMASQITSLTIVYSTIYSGADQRKHQSSASLAFVRGIHRGPVNSPHKGPVTRKWFHLMTSSFVPRERQEHVYLILSISWPQGARAPAGMVLAYFPFSWHITVSVPGRLNLFFDFSCMCWQVRSCAHVATSLHTCIYMMNL